jgi:peptide/nickel transport system substrate-binding protein
MFETSYRRAARRGRISRRGLLGVAAGTGLAGLGLVGCSNPEKSSQTSSGGQRGAAATTTTGGGTAQAATPKRGGRFQDYITQDPASLDPYKVVAFTAQTYVGGYVFSRLYQYDNGPGVDRTLYKAVPDLAVSNEVTDGGLTYIIKIRPDAKFHNVAPVNGRLLEAEDVTASYKRFVGLPAPQSPSFTANVDKVETVDKQTVKFTLKAPYAAFFDLISSPNFLWIMPREAGNGYNPEEKAIGTGPWVLEKFTPSVGLTYQRHPDYFVKDLPYMDGVDLFVVSEYAQQVNQIKSGRLYELTPQAQDFQDIVKALPGASVVDIGIPNGHGGIGFPHLDPNAPTLKDERVRKAISLAMDRDGLIEAVSSAAIWKSFGQTIQTKLNNFMPAALGRWWIDPRGSEMGDSAQWFKYDPAAAKKLLAAAGFPDGLPIEYHRTVSVYGANYDTAAEAVVPMLQAAGFKPDVKVDDYRSVWEPTSWAGKTNGLVFGLGSAFTDPDTILNYWFGPDSSRNHMQVKDPQLTALMAKQRQQLDEQERRKTVIEIQKYLGDKMYFVPVYYGTFSQKSVAPSFVKGWADWQPPSGSYGVGTESRYPAARCGR